MVITALRRAQNQNRRRPEIIMVGSAVVITRIIPRSPRQARGQTFRRLPHRPGRRRRARRSSLRLHLPQHRKPTARFTRSGSEGNFAAAFVFVPEVRQTREFRRDKKASRTDFVTNSLNAGGQLRIRNFGLMPVSRSPSCRKPPITRPTMTLAALDWTKPKSTFVSASLIKQRNNFAGSPNCRSRRAEDCQESQRIRRSK